MKTIQQIENKLKEHEIHIEYVKSLPFEEYNESMILNDIVRLEYGMKALKWVLSDDDLLKPEE